MVFVTDIQIKILNSRDIMSWTDLRKPCDFQKSIVMLTYCKHITNKLSSIIIKILFD